MDIIRFFPIRVKFPSVNRLIILSAIYRFLYRPVQICRGTGIRRGARGRNTRSRRAEETERERGRGRATAKARERDGSQAQGGGGREEATRPTEQDQKKAGRHSGPGAAAAAAATTAAAGQRETAADFYSADIARGGATTGNAAIRCGATAGGPSAALSVGRGRLAAEYKQADGDGYAGCAAATL